MMTAEAMPDRPGGAQQGQGPQDPAAPGRTRAGRAAGNSRAGQRGGHAHWARLTGPASLCPPHWARLPSATRGSSTAYSTSTRRLTTTNAVTSTSEMPCTTARSLDCAAWTR